MERSNESLRSLRISLQKKRGIMGECDIRRSLLKTQLSRVSLPLIPGETVKSSLLHVECGQKAGGTKGDVSSPWNWAFITS